MELMLLSGGGGRLQRGIPPHYRPGNKPYVNTPIQQVSFNTHCKFTSVTLFCSRVRLAVDSTSWLLGLDESLTGSTPAFLFVISTTRGLALILYNS